MSNCAVAVAALFYRAAILCYPGWFRRRYSRSLVDAFNVFCRRELRRRGVPGLIVSSAVSVTDAVVGGLAERRAPIGLRRGRILRTDGAIGSGGRPAGRWKPSVPAVIGVGRVDGGHGNPRPPRRPFWLPSLPGQLRITVRCLVGSPAFAVTILVTFALGIGANATMFGIIDRLLLRPPAHIEEPESIRRIWARLTIGGEPFNSTAFSYPALEDLRAVDSLAEVAGFGWSSPTLGRGERARQITARHATPDLLPMLGVEPLLGVFFDDGHMAAGTGDVAVLGHELWRGEFGGSREVLGRTIDLSGISHTVIGVMPPGFTGIDLQRVDVWLPVASSLRGDPERWRNNRGSRWISVVGRVADGVTDEAASDELTAVFRASAEPDSWWEDADAVLAPALLSLGPGATSDSKVALWLAGVSVIVLLVACANITNMLLAHGLRRRREIGVRLALGISRLRLGSELFLEGFVLAVAGGALALLLAFWSGKLVRSTLLPDVLWNQSPISARVLLFTASATLISALLSALAPILQARRLDVHEILKSAGTTTTRRAGGHAALVVAQIALSATLLVGAGLFTRSLYNVSALDIGFDKRTVVVAQPRFDRTTATDVDLAELFAATGARLQELPWVSSVATANTAPFLMSRGAGIRVPGIEEIPRLPTGGPYRHDVSHGYFSTMGLEIKRGRPFTVDDDRGATPVIIVGETMARLLWEGDDPLDKCVIVRLSAEENPCRAVVGVVEDARRDTMFEGATVQFYLPMGQTATPPSVMFLRLEPGAADGVRDALRREFLATSDTYRFVSLQTFDEIIAPELRSWNLGASVFAGLGALALIMVVVGLVGSLSSQVAERRREIGVRIALGASRARVVTGTVVRSVRWVLVGLVVGLLITVAAGRRIEPLLYGVEVIDPTVLAGVCTTLLLVAVLAAVWPAWRAGSIDPTESLRLE